MYKRQLESIDVGNRDSPHVGDLPSLLGGHPSDGAHLSRNDHSESLTEDPIFMARSEAKPADKPADKIVLSLCDGMGCMALALRSQWKELGYTRYIAVEKDKGARGNPPFGFVIPQPAVSVWVPNPRFSYCSKHAVYANTSHLVH